MTSRWMFSVLLVSACNPKGAGDAPQPARSAEPAAHTQDDAAAPSATIAQQAPPSAPGTRDVASTTSAETTAAAQGASASPADVSPKRRYVAAFLGDSITADQFGGGQFIRVLKERCPESRFLNFGRGGDMTNQMLARLRSDLLPEVDKEQIDTLVVYGGVNDLYSDLSAGRKNDKIERDLTSIYRLSKDAGLRVVAITVSPWGGFTKYFNERRAENTRLLNSWILGQKSAGTVDTVVDSFHILSCGEPDKLCRDYESKSHDGLHPGTRGHQVLGEKLATEAFSDCR